MATKTIKQKKVIADRRQRVLRTVHQDLITLSVVVLLAVAPQITGVTDWNALYAALPGLGLVALKAVVTYLYNRVRPA